METSRSFKDRLNTAMVARGIKAAELSRLTGLSKARISQYTNGIYAAKPNALCLIAEALDVSEAWLMGRDVPMGRADNTPLSPPDNISVLGVASYPVLGDIACGLPTLAYQDADEFVCGADINADFCLTAKGDSMTGARIYDGDIVYIKQTDAVDNGDIAAVIIEDEATLKRVYYYPEQSKLVLTPENPKYEPLVFIGRELENIKIIGRAVAFQSKL
ncbi:MAG: helix-turn-helix domain-containing protein [Ruminococcaceae bacterium]|nr:helix-turn-helix domain-containing protein [Oscillospiraceae bacterium]